MNDMASKNHVRSTRTKDRILRAAIACLHELGLQNTSTVDVAKRAGVSRGAMLHHYPTKKDLFFAAYEMQLGREVENFRTVASEYAKGDVSFDNFIDYFWSRFTTDTFAITVDFVVAARTDSAMLSRLEIARQTYDNALNDIWNQFFLQDDGPLLKNTADLQFTVSIFRGLGLQFLTQPDRGDLDKFVEAWKAHLNISSD